MCGVRATHRGRRRLRQTGIAHLALPDQIAHRADGVFDGNIGIDARGVIEIDVIDAQPAQAVGDGSFTNAGRPSKPRKAPLGSRSAPNFTDRMA